MIRYETQKAVVRVKAEHFANSVRVPTQTKKLRNKIAFVNYFFINKPEQNLKIFYIIIKIFCGNQRPDPNPSFFILINMRPKHFFDKDGTGYAHLYWISSTLF